MKNFIIPVQQEHKVYQNTFLQSTQVELSFSQITPTSYNDDLRDKIQGMLSRFFNSENAAVDLLREGFGVSNKERGLFYGFAQDRTLLKVDKINYVSFIESVIPQLLPIKYFVFEALGRETISSASIRKINIFTIQSENVETIKRNRNTILMYSLSPEFLRTDINDSRKIPTLIGPMDIRVFEENGIRSEIRTGIARVNGKPNLYNIVLDSIATSTILQGIQEGSLDRELLRLNDKLYDIYHWAVNKNIINHMINPQNKK